MRGEENADAAERLENRVNLIEDEVELIKRKFEYGD